jgi:hypothetical protein
MSELIAQFPQNIEPAKSGNDGREVSLLIQGQLAIDQAEAWLNSSNHGWVEIHENGVWPETSPTLPGVTPLHTYHLTPRGISKGSCIAADIARRGLDPADCAFVGDALADLQVAPFVGHVFIVHNGASISPGLYQAAAAVSNVTVTSAEFGSGFAECVGSLIDLDRLQSSEQQHEIPREAGPFGFSK